MTIVQLVVKTTDKSGMLESIEDLRQRVESGEVIAFIGVGIAPDDVTRGWSGAIDGVSRLRMMGALATLTHCYHDGTFA